MRWRVADNGFKVSKFIKEFVMKKLAVLTAVFFVFGAGAFALDLSAGGGMYFAQTYGYAKREGYDAYHYVANSNYGATLFFDATYTELGLNLGGYNYDPFFAGGGFNGFNLGFSVYGKFPFTVGSVKLFPLLGMDSQLGLAYLDNQFNELPTSKNDMGKGTAADLYNSVWIKFGAGVDANLTRSLYLRTSFLYGFKFYSSKEEDWKDDLDIDTLIYSGPTFRIAVGYKFKSL
jgi:hypothetical protein